MKFKWKTLLQKSAKKALIAGTGIGGASASIVPPSDAALVTSVSTVITFVINAAWNYFKNRKI